MLDKKYKHDIDVVVDRLVMKEGVRTRLADSVEMALRLADGTVDHRGHRRRGAARSRRRSRARCTACPMDELAPRDFSFNSPYGACPDCAGLGSRLEPDPDLVVPDPTLSLAEGAIEPFSIGQNYYPQLVAAAAKHLGVSTRHAVGEAAEEGPGRAAQRARRRAHPRRLHHARRARDALVLAVRGRAALGRCAATRRPSPRPCKEKLEEYMAVIPCKTCGGARLKPEILAVTVGGKNIHEVTTLSAKDSLRVLRGRRADRARGARSRGASSRRSSSGCASWWTSGSTTSRSSAGPRRSRAARRSASGWPRRSAPG